MSSIEIPFAIGQQVWHVGSGYRQEWIECPECAGTKAITMIQGNGVQVSLACAACSAGYEPPRGVIQRTYYEHRPVQVMLRRVEVRGNEIQLITARARLAVCQEKNRKDNK